MRTEEAHENVLKGTYTFKSCRRNVDVMDVCLTPSVPGQWEAERDGPPCLPPADIIISLS